MPENPEDTSPISQPPTPGYPPPPGQPPAPGPVPAVTVIDVGKFEEPNDPLDPAVLAKEIKHGEEENEQEAK